MMSTARSHLTKWVGRRAAKVGHFALGHNLGHTAPLFRPTETEPPHNTQEFLEAPPGFEPGMEVLQTCDMPGNSAKIRTCPNEFTAPLCLGPPESAPNG